MVVTRWQRTSVPAQRRRDVGQDRFDDIDVAEIGAVAVADQPEGAAAE